MRIVDTHQHLWDLGKLSYSWTQGHPVLNRSFLLSDYREAASGYDVEKTVFVECDVDEPLAAEEVEWVRRLAEDPGNRIAGIVAGVRPERPDFAAQIERIGCSKVKGVRRVLHVAPDDTIDKPGFIDNVRSLAKHGLSFDVCVLARQLPLALRLVRSCPEVQFILDHCGNPRIRDGEFSTWTGMMRELSLVPNLACKVSGIVTNAKRSLWTDDDLKPYVGHLVECFGFDRLMFGSDWPVCLQNSTYGRWVDALLAITGEYGEASQEQLFRTTAERVYRI